MAIGGAPAGSRPSGAVVTAAVALCYLLLWWNHFAGLRSGNGEFQGGSFFLAGLRPYRDYFTASTPLTVLKSAAELWLFGNAAIVSRACGVVERVILGVIVYLWLARMFRATYAALAAIVTIIVSSGDYADPLASYNHDAILLGVISGFLASYVLDALRSTRGAAVFATLSGICAGLCFCTKQTTGAGITAAIAVIVCACLFRLDGWRKACVFLAGYAAGWIIPAVLLFVWLTSLGALHACLKDIFVSGPAAKASNAGDFLFREIFYLKLFARPFLLACAALALSWTALRSAASQQSASQRRLRPVLWILALGIAAVAIGAVASYAGLGFDATGFDRSIDRADRYLFIPAIYFAFWACTLLLVFFGILWLLGKLSRREAQFCLYAGVSLAVAFMLSLSFPVFEAMLVPGLGLPAAALLERWRGWRAPVVYAALALLIAGETYAKLDRPFGFGGINEPPVRVANARSSFPEMRGFVLPPGIMSFIDSTLRIIKTNSSPGDRIFTYPEMGLFYGLSGMTCPTSTCSHNIDVVNDQFAKREAERLLRNPPAVLIHYVEPESDLESEELVWRHGQRSVGQRDLLAAVETLAKQYRPAGTFMLSPKRYRVEVYVRPTEPAAAQSNKYR
jgi:hypothetical protein